MVKDVNAELDKEKDNKRRQRNKTKEYRAYVKLPRVALSEFWCENCQIDFAVPSYKVWSFYHNLGSWHSVCPQCEVLVVRHINNKGADTYYEKSIKMRVMRNQFSEDMLRPTDHGFRTLYGDAFEGYYRRFQERAEDIHNKYAGLGIRGTTLDEMDEKDALDKDLIDSM
jgi:hypothetical protein